MLQLAVWKQSLTLIKFLLTDKDLHGRINLTEPMTLSPKEIENQEKKEWSSEKYVLDSDYDTQLQLEHQAFALNVSLFYKNYNILAELLKHPILWDPHHMEFIIDEVTMFSPNKQGLKTVFESPTMKALFTSMSLQ